MSFVLLGLKENYWALANEEQQLSRSYKLLIPCIFVVCHLQPNT